MEQLFKRAFIQKTQNNFLMLFRYLFVAGAAFTVDFGLLILFTQLVGVNYLIAATMSFCVGVVVNFSLSVKWIFPKSKFTKLHHEFAGVMFIAIIGLVLNDLILWSLTSKLGIFYLYSKLIATILIFFWNFFIRKSLLYKKD